MTDSNQVLGFVTLDDNYEEPFELTSSQYAMWLAQQLHPHAAHSVAHYMDVRGDLNFDLLVDSVRITAAETGSLLTRLLAPGDGQDGPHTVRQFVDAAILPTELEYYDLTGSPDPIAAAREWMNAEFTARIDLHSTPLSRSAVLKVGHLRYFWYARAHHTVIDGFGSAVVAVRTGEVYTALERGEVPPPRKSRHPRAFVEAEAAYRASARIEKDRAYWAGVSAELPEPVSFSGRTAEPSSFNHRCDRTLDLHTDRALASAAGTYKTTVAALVVAAFAAYLARATDTDDVVLTLPMAARVTAWARSSASMTANAVPIGARIESTTTISELIDTIGHRIGGALRHQLLPAAEIAGDLRASGATLGPTINPMLFGDRIRLGDLDARLDLLTSGPTADMAVTLHTNSDNGQMRVDIEGNPATYELADIEMHSARFAQFLHEFATRPTDCPIGSIGVLTETDRHLLLHEWSGGAPAALATVPQIFDRGVRLAPDRPAIVDGDTVVEYRELDRRSNMYARHLISMGVGPDVPVAVVLPRSHRSVTMVWAITKAGGAYVPIDPAHPLDRIERTLADCGARVGVTTRDRLDGLPSDIDWIIAEDNPFRGLDDGPIHDTDRLTPLTLDHTAYVIYTSGSTGIPKGVAVTHRGIGPIADAAIAAHATTVGSRVMHFVSPGFDASVLEMFLAFGAGGTLVVLPTGVYGGDELGALLTEHCIDAGFITPSALATVSPTAGSTLVSIGVGGDAVPAALVDDWAPGRRMVDVYGPTETTVAVTLGALEAGKKVALGRPIDGIRAYVLDSRLHPTPPGCVGELYIGGTGVARGYHARRGLTASRFVADPFGGGRLYRTGDLVRWTTAGELTYIGRRDHQVKVRGFRIELGEIEEALRAHPQVSDAVVVVRGDGVARTLVGYVVAENGAMLSPDEVTASLVGVLPAYMVPHRVNVLDAFELNANGKVDRRRLPEPVEQVVAERREPRTTQEVAVAQMFCEVLDVPSVSATDDFFALGGNSLLATVVAARLAADGRYRVGVREVFLHSTVERLAAALVDLVDDTGCTAPVAVSRTEPLPASPSQRSMWWIERYQPSAAYHIPLALRVRGRLDIPAIRLALEDVVRRHESLRTVFTLDPSESSPLQVVLDAPSALHPLPFDAVTIDGTDVDDTALLAALTDIATRPFDLEHDLPLRGRAISLPDRDEHVVALVLHHICADGWSLGVLASDIGEAYRARLNGTAPQWDSLSIQYVDAVAWQRSELGEATDTGSSLSNLRTWWSDTLAGLPDTRPPGTMRARPSTPSGLGAAVSTVLSSYLKAAVDRLAADTGSTEFMVVHAALALLMSRSGVGDDVVIGTAVAGRGHRDLDRVVGMFVNSVVLRTAVTSSHSVREHVLAIRSVDIEALSRGHMPFDSLVEHLDPARLPGRHPLFQVMLTERVTPDVEMEIGGAAVSAYDIELPVTKYDLEVVLARSAARPGETTIVLTYARDLYDAPTAEALLQRLTSVLAQMAAEPGRPIDRIDVLIPSERARLLPMISGRTDPRGVSIHRALRDSARRTPNAVALVEDERSMTYGHLDALVTRGAAHLRSRGVGAETRVVGMLPRSIESVLCVLAVARSGGVYVPVDPAYPEDRRDFMVRDSGAVVGLTHLRVDGSDGFWLSMDSLFAHAATYGRDVPEVSPTNAAYVIYTSGTTGTPKGVEVSRQAYADAGAELVRAFDADSRSRVLAFASPSFDASMLEIALAIRAGGTLTVVPADILGAAELEAVIDVHRVTHCFLTPSVLATLDLAGPALTSMTTIGIGGENFGPELLTLAAAGRRVVNVYGPTESTISTHLPALDPTRDVSIGMPVAGVRATVLDARLSAVPSGVTGELHLAGGQLARGYVDRPALTATRFVADPFGPPGSRMYRTGDLAYVDGAPEPTVKIVGRSDFQVKIRGLRIELGEIDAVLGAVPGVDLAVTKTATTPSGEAVLVSYVHGENAVDPDVLTRIARDRLPRHMVPARILVLDAIPLTPVGKLDRSALPAPSFGAASLDDQPRTELESILVQILSEVVDVPSLGTSADFFALGGTSLSATRYATRIGERLGYHVPVRTIFDNPTVAELATHLDAAQENFEESVAQSHWLTTELIERVRSTRGTAIPLSPQQQAMWITSRIASTATAYNIVGGLRVTGAFDPHVLEAALNDVVHRHESLRTTFPTTATGPIQRVWPERRIEVSIADSRESYSLVDLLAQAGAQPFDLSVDLPVRATVARIGDDEYVVVLVVHHIAADGESIAPLSADLLFAFTTRENGSAPVWPNQPLQYAEYQLALEAAMADGARATGLDYWTETLRDAPVEHAVPLDMPRPSSPTGRAATVTVSMPAEVRARVCMLARTHRSSEFMVVHTALAALVSDDTTDVVIGTPHSGRGGTALDSMVGMAVNTLALRTGIARSASFTEALAAVRETDLDAFEHALIPFDEIVSALGQPRHPARNPIVQIVLAVQDSPPLMIDTCDRTISTIEAPITTSAFDLVVSVRPGHDGSADVRITYARELFLPSTARHLAQRLVEVLDRAAAAPSSTVGELLDASAIAASPPTLSELFQAAVALDPSAVAVAAADGSMTYCELDDAVAALTDSLRAAGAGPGTCVALAAQRSLASVTAFWAIARTGAAVLPLDPSYPSERLRYILEDAAPILGLCDGPDADLPRGNVPWTSIRDVEPVVTNVPAPQPHPDDIAYVVYTSGTTGRPKPVAVTHRGLERFAVSLGLLFDTRPRSRVLHVASPGFDAAILEMLLVVVRGSTCVVAPSSTFAGTQLGNLIRRERVDTIFITPAALGTLSPDALLSVTTIGTGGEALSAALLDTWAEGRRFVNAYGPSESTVAATMGLQKTAVAPHIGSAVPGTSTLILDSDLHRVDGPNMGELYVAGAGLARGYLGRPGLTATRFVANPYGAAGSRLYRTGDLVRSVATSDGSQLRILGRSDSQTKIRGVRVEPAEVEAVLSANPSVQSAVVLVEDTATGSSLVAHVSTTDVVDADHLRAAMSEVLPRHLVPARIVLHDRLPLTSHGKVDRVALAAGSVTTTVVRANGSTVDAVRSAFASVLAVDVDTVDADSDFFALGGNSLAAVMVMDTLREQVTEADRDKVDVTWFFDVATPDAIAARLDALGHSGVTDQKAPVTLRPRSPFDVLIPLRGGSSDRAPLFCIHPAIGLVWSYTGILPYLDADTPVVGIQARGIVTSAPQPESVKEMARDYVNAIRMEFPKGPYRLAGWSLGGLIAQDMAVEFEKQGEDVELIVLDAYPLCDETAPRQEMSVADLLREFVGEFEVEDDLTLDDAIALVRRQGGAATLLDDDQIRRLYDRYRLFVRLGYEHRPEFFGGDLTFFSASRYRGVPRSPWEWRQFVGGTIADHPVPTTHNEMGTPKALAEVARSIESRTPAAASGQYR
ncbi:amino acid adenylation domain-containing protein [Rhodococcus sp. 077-4]|uniref:non-ribosomal peptide synthetase n=1 Tax=Rhodococcus sp. 077-4 TaxID=2789271 RepID=UPI0039F5DAE5